MKGISGFPRMGTGTMSWCRWTARSPGGSRPGIVPRTARPLEGYKHWHYFGCLVFPLAGRVDPGEIQALRISQAKANALLLKAWAAELPIELDLSHWPD